MALGRGLGEILFEVEEAYEKDLGGIDSFELEAQDERIEEIPVNSISPNPFQPRKHFDVKALRELSESIKKHGLLQPIVVIEREDGYLLVAGERRLRAHKIAKFKTVKAIIADVDIDQVRLRELALIENIQRENLNAIELASAYAELIDVHNITHSQLSLVVHKSRSQITNTMRLLSLSKYAQEQVLSGRISQGHAKMIVAFDKEQQKEIINSIIEKKLSVRDTEKIVKQYKEGSSLVKVKVSAPNLLKKYTKFFEVSLPFDFKIKERSIEINFQDEQEIEKFLELLS